MEVSGHIHVPGRFNPDETTPGGWVGHRAGLNAVAKSRNTFSGRELNSGRPAYSIITILTELPRPWNWR